MIEGRVRNLHVDLDDEGDGNRELYERQLELKVNSKIATKTTFPGDEQRAGADGSGIFVLLPIVPFVAVGIETSDGDDGHDDMQLRTRFEIQTL